jgi:hypothetical protein
MMETAFYPKARSKDLVVQNILSETLIYDLANHQAHCLNETAAFIWRNCSGDASVDNLVRLAESEFGGPVHVDVITLALTQFNDHKLLIEDVPVGRPLLNRRQAIKKIGLASAIALPVIASLATPAQTLGTLSCSGCINPAACFSMPGCGNSCNGSGDCVPLP